MKDGKMTEKENNLIVKLLRNRYREARLDLKLSLREASKLLDITPSELSRIEHGPPPEIKVDKTRKMDVHCGHCKEPMQVHPIIDPFILFPFYCCDNCATDPVKEIMKVDKELEEAKQLLLDSLGFLDRDFAAEEESTAFEDEVKKFLGENFIKENTNEMEN